MFKIVCVTILALMFVGYTQQSPLPQGGGADGSVGGGFQMGAGAGAGAGGAGQGGAGANGGAGFSMGAGAQGGAGAGGKK